MSTFMNSSGRGRSAAKLNLLAAGLALLLTLPFIGSARADSETRTVEPFHAISVEGSWTVDVTVGKVTSVALEGDKDTLARISTDVVDGELRIHPGHAGLMGFFRSGKLVAHITTPALDSFVRSGSGDATITGLNEGKITLESNGSGTIAAAGHAGDLKLELNGSGTAKLADLAVDSAKVTINGSGDVVVQPHKSLEAEINGSGDIKYIGDPAHMAQAIHGSGSIEKM